MMSRLWFTALLAVHWLVALQFTAWSPQQAQMQTIATTATSTHSRIATEMDGA